MNRSLKLSMLLLAALGSGQAVALELGQIQVKSALGQPLLAEISVTPEGAGDLRNLRAQMASNEDFERAGITDGRTKVPLRFAVVSGPGNTKLIRITSAQAINDPFLDLLVEVDNASGKSVREFTILLDPPGRRSSPAALVAARSSGPVQSRRSSEPEAARAAAPVLPGEKPAAPAVTDGKYGPVQSGDTLTAIARQVSSGGVELNQMLLAMKRSNPDAFYRDNINALKRGAILRVPTAEQARAMSVSAALAEVRRQNGDWRAQAAGAPTRVADAATGAEKTTPSETAASGSDHLALVPSRRAGASAGAGGNDAGAAGNKQDLERSQENVASLQQQGVEQKSRIDDLQDINRKNERLLALKNSEIADLQQKLAQARRAAGMPASAGTAAAADAAALTAAMPQGASSAAGSSAPVSAIAATSAPASANSAPVSKVASAPVSPAAVATVAAARPVAVSRPAPAAAAQPWYLQLWVWIAGGVVLLLLLLLGLRGRGRESAKRPLGGSLADRFGSEPAALDDEAPSDLLDADQEELLDHLAEHPDDVGLHLELVSLYYHRRDVERFETAAEAMYAHVTNPQQSEWQDVVAMGKVLAPSHPLFGGAPVSYDDDIHDDVDEREALDAFDLDAYAAGENRDFESDDDAISAPPARGTYSEYQFDFNLSHPDHDQRLSPLADPDQAVDGSAHDEHVDPLPGENANRVIEPTHAGEAEWDLDRLDDEPFSSGEVEPLEPSIDPFSSDRFEPVAPVELGEFSDDPVDTKLDLARAYLDMGDSDGARAMLDEVVAEGTQMQRDMARELLQKLA